MDPQTDTMYAPYGYVPTMMVTILFLALFSISTVAHLGQAVSSRMWWLLPTVVLCGALEILGWAARFWSSTSPALFVPFQIQIIGTVLAPTPLFAANFIILGKLIEYLGPVYSRMGPRWYTIVFFTCDVTSLVVQAVGGAMASLAAGNDSDPTPGGNVMLVGIILQMATITIYILCAVEFCIRYIHRRPISGASMYLRSGFSPVRRSMDAPLRWMSVALVSSTTWLFIRAVYRTIELSDGWTGRIFRTEVYFNVLDGAMVVLAMYTLNFAHPGVLLATITRKPWPVEKSPSESETWIGWAI